LIIGLNQEGLQDTALSICLLYLSVLTTQYKMAGVYDRKTM